MQSKLIAAQTAGNEFSEKEMSLRFKHYSQNQASETGQQMSGKDKKRKSLGLGFMKLFKKKKKNPDEAKRTDSSPLDKSAHYDTFFPYNAPGSPKESLRTKKMLSEPDKRIIFNTFQNTDSNEMAGFFVEN